MGEIATAWADRFTERTYEKAGYLATLYNRRNYRQHPDRQRAITEASLDALGVIGEIKIGQWGNRVVDGCRIFDGHLRVELALAKAGPDAPLPVNWYALSEQETDQALLYHDTTTGMAEIDFAVFDELVASVPALDVPEWSDWLAEFTAEAGPNGAGGNEPAPVTQTEAERYQEVWQVESGDVWELGRHRIACLDSLNEESVRGLIGDSVVTFVWSDPPYGIEIVAANVSVGGGEAYDIPFGGRKQNKGYVGGGARIKASPGFYPIESWGKNRVAKGLGSTDGAKPFGNEKVRGSDGASNLIAVGKYFPVIGDDTIETAVQSSALLLNLYPDACHVWWGGNYYAHTLPPSPGWIVWDKDNTGNFADCELAWTNQHRAARIFEHRWNGMLKASEQGQRRVHPTQKPVVLAQECYQEYGKPEDVIFDPFLGSGISILAAESLNDGRRVIGCELAPEYIATVLSRWADLTNLTPRRLSG